MKGAQYMTWVLFFVSCLLMKNRGMAGIGALVAGIVRRCGVPKFNTEFLQTLIVEENFQLVGLLAVASMQGSLIAFAPLIIFGLLQCANITMNQTGMPGFIGKIVNIGFMKSQMAKVTQN